MKKIIAIILVIISIFTFAACGVVATDDTTKRPWSNKDWVDTVYYYDEATLLLQDGTVVRGQVEQWTDFEEGDQIQIRINGKTYLTHISNVTLIQN